jgi:hypothetical protein
MDTYYSDISKVCSKRKSTRGDKSKSLEIPSIETSCGIYEGINVLEGFRANTEKICNEKPVEPRMPTLSARCVQKIIS